MRKGLPGVISDSMWHEDRRWLRPSSSWISCWAWSWATRWQPTYLMLVSSCLPDVAYTCCLPVAYSLEAAWAVCMLSTPGLEAGTLDTAWWAWGPVGDTWRIDTTVEPRHTHSSVILWTLYNRLGVRRVSAPPFTLAPSSSVSPA